MKFVKYHGTGNDFIIIDARGSDDLPSPDEITALCRRNTGIGADGVIFACTPSSAADVAMRIFNADGSEAEMCANGIRCLAKFLHEKQAVRKSSMIIQTLSGPRGLELAVEGGIVSEVEVEMGLPDFQSEHFPAQQSGSGVGEISIDLESGEALKAICLSMGNPHCVLFVDDVESAPVSQLGPALEHHEMFPNRTNVEFAQLLHPGHLKIRVWERGVGETAACGTGACAAFAAALQTGRGESPMTVTLRGGDLRTRVDQYGHIFMSGPAVEVYTGELSPNWRG